MEGLDRFLTVSFDYGTGHANGSGYGDGSGSGYANGYGYGDGSGSGYGNGYGYGYGYGNGYGDGDGDGVKVYNDRVVHYIDDVQTLIDSVKGFVAKGEIVNSDLTTTACYVVRVGNSFAHGETLKEAKRDAENKHFNNLSEEERVAAFLEEFKDFSKPIKMSVFFEWHYKLTGSCEMGRRQFLKDKGISLDDELTVNQFIELTSDSYGGNIIKQLKKKQNE